MKTAVIYARYSSDKQTEQSIEGQLRVCNEYADRNDIVIVNTYIDRAMTGTNDKRTKFQLMLKDSEKKAWDYVLVYKLDRFGRNKYEMAINKKTLKDNGVKLLSAMENIPDTPEGIILESLLEGMAEYYSAELAQKVKRGMNESRLKGLFSGGRPPYGYKVEKKKVYINEDEAACVKYLFEEFAKNRQVSDVRKEFTERGIFNRGKPFGKNSLYKILKNEKYTGIAKFNDITYDKIYPQIIPQELFDIAQQKMDANKYGKHPADIVYLLKNKVRCGYCGHPVSSETGTSKNGNVMRYYKCRHKKDTKCCHLDAIRKELLEETIINTIIKSLNTNENLSQLADNILIAHNKKINDNSVLNILTKDLETTEKAIKNILNAIEQGIITSSTKEHLELLEQRKEELKEKILLEKANNKMVLSKETIIKYMQNLCIRTHQNCSLIGCTECRKRNFLV